MSNCTMQSDSTSAHGSSSKRSISQGKPMTHLELVRHDIKRARREKECKKAKPIAAITLFQREPTTLSPNMLSPKLQDSFAHIFKHKQ